MPFAIAVQQQQQQQQLLLLREPGTSAASLCLTLAFASLFPKQINLNSTDEAIARYYPVLQLPPLTEAETRTRNGFIGSGSAGGRHSGALMLRRYAATSASLA